MLKKNILSVLTALVILYLSLANSHTFDKVPTFHIPEADKIIHIAMYFGLMTVILLENRYFVNSARRAFIAGLIPLGYGILMEILQGALTVTRTASFFDALADLAGILLSVAIWFIIKPYIRKEIR